MTGKEFLKTYQLNKKDRDRFFSKIKIQNSCWIWIGYITNNNPVFVVKNKGLSAKQFSYWISGNKILNQREGAYTVCKNFFCVNPKHLILDSCFLYCKNGHYLNSNNTTFYKNKYILCRKCAIGRTIKYRKINPEKYNQLLIRGKALRQIGDAKIRAEQKRIPFDLDKYKDKIKERFNFGKCELSGISFQYFKEINFASPSIDRIDSSKGYTYDNIRIICWGLNSLFNSWGEEASKEFVIPWLRNSGYVVEKIKIEELKYSPQRRLRRSVSPQTQKTPFPQQIQLPLQHPELPKQEESPVLSQKSEEQESESQQLELQ